MKLREIKKDEILLILNNHTEEFAYVYNIENK